MTDVTKPRTTLSLRYFQRILRLFIGCAIVLTMILVVESIWQQHKNLKTELSIYQRTFERSMAAALWALDWEKLDSIAAGVIEIPAISGLRINHTQHQDEDLKMGTLPEKDGAFGLSHRFVLIADEDFGGEVIGEVEMFSTFEHLLRRSGQQILLILFLGITKTLALAWIAYVVGRRLIARPLMEMTQSIADTDQPEPMRLSVDTRNMISGTELETLQIAFDHLAERAQEAQTSLIAANKHLDQRVQQRTAELLNANKKLELMANTDALTGLANRRYLWTMAQTLMSLSRRNGQPLSLIICDIDFFKGVNDTHGHEIGDRAICHVADCLRKAVREIDVVARFGGDEFILMLPGITSGEAFVVATRLHNLVADTEILDAAGKHLPLTLSCGIAEWSPDDHRLEDLLLRADALLYRAKKGGRDQTVTSNVTMESHINP